MKEDLRKGSEKQGGRIILREEILSHIKFLLSYIKGRNLHETTRRFCSEGDERDGLQDE